MARNGLSEDEIKEVYEHLKSNLPGIPDTLIREISGNDFFDALQDVDANDIVATLSAPGPIAVFSCPVGSECTPESVTADLVANITASDIKLSTVAGAFLILKSHKWCMADFGQFRNLINGRLHPFSNLLSTWYHDRRLAEFESMKLILVGISTFKKFEFIRRREGPCSHFSHPMDIPAFLRKSVENNR